MADSYKTLICPACGEKMKKIFVPKCGFHIDICENGCGGIFFDNKELGVVNDYNEDMDDELKTIENADYSRVNIDRTAVRICPACGNKMVKNPTSVNRDIFIDECYNCGGKFFDHGELTQYILEYSAEKDCSKAAMRVLLNSNEAKEIRDVVRSGGHNSLLKKLLRIFFFRF